MIDYTIAALIDKDTPELIRQYLKQLPPSIIEDFPQRKVFEELKKDDVDVMGTLEDAEIDYSQVLDTLESEEYGIWSSMTDQAKVSRILERFNEWKKGTVCKYIQEFERGVLSDKVGINKAVGHLHDRIANLPTLDEDDSFITGVEGFLNGLYQNIDRGTSTIVPIPFTRLGEELNGGFRKKDIVVLNGSTGMGKTMLIQNFVRFWAKLGIYKVLYVSTEMSKDHLIARWIRQEGYSQHKMITDDMILKPTSREAIQPVIESAQSILDYDIHFCMLKKKIEDIEFAMRKRNYDIVVIDHLHQLKGVDEPDQLEKILDKLNLYADEKDALIVLLAQSRKEDAYGKNKTKPHLGSLRGSSKLIDISAFIGAIYEDSDLDSYIFKILKDRHNGITGREIPLDFIKTGCIIREKGMDR